MAVEICQVCEKEIGQFEKAFVFKGSIVCEKCYEFLRKTEDKYRFDSIYAVNGFNIRQLGGAIGACLLIVGVFLPFLGNSFKSVDYFSFTKRNLYEEGYFIIFLAAISFIPILANKCEGLWVTGLISLFVMGYTFYMVVQEEIVSDSFESYGFFLKDVHLEWGFIVMIIAAFLLLAAGVIKENKRDIIESKTIDQTKNEGK